MSYNIKRVTQKFGGYFTGMTAYAARALDFKYPVSRKTIAIVVGKIRHRCTH